ncbi:MAG TPA: prepilin-type N-terminal cleavage/methylation domain-containing protein [Candidatus Paceibacterota bacterium]|nr:prepilin-type N-terminal cleavage/methylation domain-containing protein [Candidatus Paceibacterota bacterium]
MNHRQKPASFLPKMEPSSKKYGRESSFATKVSGAGFTLIEMLVVIAIVGLLSSTILVGLGSARSKARDARRIADLRQIQTGLENYYVEHNQSYPQELYTSISGLPHDPQGGEYGYFRVSSQAYVVGACLENDRGSDIQSVSGSYDVSPVGSLRVPPPSCTCDDQNSYCVSVGLSGR